MQLEFEHRLLTLRCLSYLSVTLLLLFAGIDLLAQDADQILVMDKGVIVERGTHQSLLALDGAYADLCREQSMATA